MIEQVDRRLGDWVRSVVGEREVSFAPPVTEGDGTEEGGARVSLYLMGLADRPPHRGRLPAPLQVDLLYLVTTSARDPREAHRLLGELLFAALEDPEMEVRLPGEELWRAFSPPPRPGFVLRRPASRERQTAPARRVTRPLSLQASPMAVLAGRVEGPGGVPLANARVELPALARAAETDSRGRFRFVGVPANGGHQELRVSARGHEISVTTGNAGDGPLVVPFNPWEE